MSRDTAGPLVGAGTTGLTSYNAAALASATTVIAQYSTSFGLAARLLAPALRDEVRSIYALVRIADEIVDGAASGAGIDVAGQGELLDDLEQETERAMARGFSTNLVVHAFAVTARRVGIDPGLTRPFFASMRRDLDPAPFTEQSVAEYIYGSAEVVGLMCLRSFLRESPRSPRDQAILEHGARSLGAAFQKVNFLRDLAADTSELGRSYFPGLDPLAFSDEHKNALVREIRADLHAAALGVPHLAPRAARAVAMAHGLFSELNHRLERTPAAELMTRRISVPPGRKTLIALRTVLGGRPAIATTAPATKGQP